ncbi:Transposase [Paracholeplasma brassicae]|uniref:Transposase n=1 Tax=Acholeplasma brassicae TaxID=61635 RepID=U4KPY2_9MOLU|nr:transposase [Paracholeplasma brassicae]CCV66567.1 Transposase [Paracholeplasma brassicae]
MAKAYDQTFKNKIIKERLSGLSVKSISIKHGVSVSVIHKWLKTTKEDSSNKSPLINVTELIKTREISFKLSGHLVRVELSDLPQFLQALKS